MMMEINNRRREQGSASVFALLVGMFLLLLVTASMVLTMADAKLTQDYSRNKKTFQASDSGLAHGRQTMALATSTFNLPANTNRNDVTDYADDADANLRTEDKDISLLVTAGGADRNGSFEEILSRNTVKTNETIESTADGLNVDYDVSYDVYPDPDNPVTRPSGNSTAHAHTFHYKYDVYSTGSATIGGEYNQATRMESGIFDVDVSRPPFSTYGYFTQGMKNQFGDQLVFYDGEVYSGPTHVNSAPPEGRAGFWGTPVFNGAFTAVQDDYADSWLGGNANPQFNAGATWGVEQITLPDNAWSQLRASVGDEDNADDTSPVSNAELRDYLGLPVSSDPVDDGVYFADNYNNGSDLLGGLFIQGDVDWIEFRAEGDFQFIVIQTTAVEGQFSGTHTWEFRSSQQTGRTRFRMDNGVDNFFNTNLNGLIHVEGNVNSLLGNASGTEIEDHHQLTLSVTDNIYISDNIEYEIHPDDNPDALNILGLFSSNGNIYLAEDAPSDITVHASVMAASDYHGVGAENIVTEGGSYDYSYPDKGDWNLLGGLIENRNQTTGVYYSDGTVTGYRWNFDYDERFSQGVAPPFFPYVTRFIIQMSELERTGWSRRYY